MSPYLQALTRAYMLAPEYSEEEQVLAALWDERCEHEGVSQEEAEEWERTTRQP